LGVLGKSWAGNPALVLPRIMQAADHYRNEKLAILTTITPVAK
jgi:hypothetical protein